MVATNKSLMQMNRPPKVAAGLAQKMALHEQLAMDVSKKCSAHP